MASNLVIKEKDSIHCELTVWRIHSVWHQYLQLIWYIHRNYVLVLQPSVSSIKRLRHYCFFTVVGLYQVLSCVFTFLLTCKAIWPWRDHSLIDIILLSVLFNVVNCSLQRCSQMLWNRSHARMLRGRRSQLSLGWRSDSGLYISKGERRANSDGCLVLGSPATGICRLPGGNGADAPHRRRGGRSLGSIRGCCPLDWQGGGWIGVRRKGSLLSNRWRTIPAAQRRSQRPPWGGNTGADHVRGGLCSGWDWTDAPHDSIGRNRLFKTKNIY